MAGECGYAGRILRVDLSSGRITSTPTIDYADRFIGGRGVGLKIYWDEVSPEVKALDPENRLMFMTGPAAGISPGVAGTRWIVCGKSPSAMPEQFSYCNLGGDWGTELKFAGYDGLVVQGKADKPVYLFIEDDKIEIRDASHLWNKKTTEARQILKGELGEETRVVSSGPAGDNMVVNAVVFADHDASGTGGFGAVMGSKKLKAIAVRGSGKEIPVANPGRLAELHDYIEQLIEAVPRQPNLSVLAAPTKKEEDHCRSCDIGCDRDVFEAKNGTKSKFICEPAYWYAIRAQRYYEGKENWSEIPFFATVLCNEYGVDVNAFDSLVYWLTRCYRAGIISDESTGIPFSKEGSLEYLDTLLKKMSLRDGFGDIIANGTHRAAELLGQGSDKLITDFMVNAGQNGSYNPRFYILTGLLYALEPRQPIQQLHDISSPFLRWVNWIDKRENAFVSTDILRAYGGKFLGSEQAVDFSTYEGKALAAKKIQDRVYPKESMILCDRTWPIRTTTYTDDNVGDPSLESKVYSAITGKEVDEAGFYKMGERIFNLQRAIRVREVGNNDTLPDFHFTMQQKRVYGNPGAIALKKEGDKWVTYVKEDRMLDRDKFDEMKKEFYQLRGWDVNSGLQTKAKLEELGLGDIIGDLAQRKLIA
jgi:aldehyde:ferredoxin oxidoreductase